MNTIFDICVNIMIVGSDYLGITYQQFNVLLFVVIQPILIFIFFIYSVYLKGKIKGLKLSLKK